jgi:hypothetical protein
MEPRRKPIPNPLPRAAGVRGLVAASGSRALPTVAAILAATSLLACSGEATDISADQQVMRATLHAEKPAEVAMPAQPGMGGLEIEADVPAPHPSTKPVVTPPKLPPTPAGGPRPIAPVPTTPKLAGKIAPVHTKTI